VKTLACFCLVLTLAACAAPEPEDVILEPINEQNIYDPSAASTPPANDKERLVAAIEAEGCVLNAENSQRVLTALGIADEQLAQIGAELMQEGRVQVTPPAEFRLTTGVCAS